MLNGGVYKCDFCNVESTSPLRIGLTTDPVSKHFCDASHFVAYCDLHKRLQNTLAYAMYKDLVDSTESNIPQPEDSRDT